jgi:hypothetical protein
MIRFRVLESFVDLCCLPSPHRILQSVAGMAFNFSKIELPPPAIQLTLPLWDMAPSKPALSALVESRGATRAASQHSPAS